MKPAIIGSVNDVLKRSIGSYVVYSDTMGDPDARRTTITRSNLPHTARFDGHKITSTTEAAYYLELEHQLHVSQLADAEELKTGKHENKQAFLDFQRQQISTQEWVLANIAPRVGTTENGKDFYLAITNEDLAIIAVPLEALKYVRAKIRALLRVPTEEVFGRNEQFRSSRVLRDIRLHPKKLVPIFQHLHTEEVCEAELQNIPGQENPSELAFHDTFGNTRTRCKALLKTLEVIDEKVNASGVVGVKLLVNNEPETFHVIVKNGHQHLACLRDIPDGEMGLYINPADRAGANGDPGYLEINRKWKHGDPHSIQSAHQILRYPKPGTPIEFVAV